MSLPTFRLVPLLAGQCTLGQNHVLGEPYSDDDRIEFALYAFLADGGPGRRVLVDLGPVGLPFLNDMFRRYHFFRDLPGDPDAIRQPRGNVFDGLDRMGLAPADIDHVVFSHMHADHHGLTDGTDGGAILAFPHAMVHVSKIGWQYNLDRRVDGRWNSYVDVPFADHLEQRERQGRVRFHDDDEVIDGIGVLYLGGHAPCSQAVRIRTDFGPAIVTSDEVYRYDLLAAGVIARICTTPERLLAANEKLAALALEGAMLLPCHEPLIAKLFDEHGDDWLRHVKPVSDQAAADFRESTKRMLGK